MSTPTWNSREAIENSIHQYKQQFTEAGAAIQGLDAQRAQLVESQHTLVGAVAALEQLLQNQKDEEALAAKPADATSAEPTA